MKARNIPVIAASSTGFRTGSAFNDPSQNINVTKVGNHYFNTAGNSNLQIPNATVKTTESPGSTQSSAPVKTATDPVTGATTTSDKPIPVPDSELNFDNQFGTLSTEELDARIEANEKILNKLREKSSDNFTEEESQEWKKSICRTKGIKGCKRR